MNIEVAVWVIAGAIIPAVVYAFGMKARATSIKNDITEVREDTSLLVTMHRDPDQYGFGTTETNEAQKENTRAVRDLTHYIIVSIENQTGQKPKPPLGIGGAGT